VTTTSQQEVDPVTAAQTRDRLASLLVEPLAAVGLDLEDVDLSSAGRRRVLRIAVDRDGGVSLDDVADATREVSKVLDDSEVMGEQPYTLEVGSPGVDRPLTHPRHWRRNHDRLVDVRLADGARLTGRIAASDDVTATLLVDGEEQQVPLADVERARIQIEFKRKDG
jgi:ribosome maturation factor RimP